VVINNAPRTIRQVALTFDSDSEGGHGLDIMQWLAAHQVPATIFMTGDWTDHTADGPKILGIIQAHPDLFTLGNHSYSHPHFDQLTPDQMRAELRAAAASFVPYTTQDPRPFWRPPYGELDDQVLDAAGAEGYRWTVLADVGLPDWRPLDFDPPGWTADQLVKSAVARSKPGTIVGLHLGGFFTYQALPRMVAGIRMRGFELVNLNQMLEPRGSASAGLAGSAYPPPATSGTDRNS
jgi:peptidoglycan/xylan/chitin deacetylase (PgdA/CDA1 family)